MKKIFGAVAALSLIGSAAFADVSVSGMGYVETTVFDYHKQGSANGTTELFGNWDYGDTDVYIDGTWGDIAGARFNLTLADGDSDRMGFGLGYWNVWVRPIDWFMIKATNEENRLDNMRVNSIIDKLEAKIGVFKPAVDSIWTVDSAVKGTAASSDATKLNGYLLDFDFNVVRLELGFNDNQVAGDPMPTMWSKTNKFPAMRFADDDTNFGFGARINVPVEGLLNLHAMYKMGYDENTTDTTSQHVFGVYADITAVQNLRLTIGYTGDYTDKSKTNVANSASSDFYNGIDLRAQYNMDKLAFALHNNITFATLAKADGYDGDGWFFVKTNLGASYSATDNLTAFLELGNQFAKYDTAGGDAYVTRDSIQIYPRVQINLNEAVCIKGGLTFAFDVIHSETIANTSSDLGKDLRIAMPLALQVAF